MIKKLLTVSISLAITCGAGAVFAQGKTTSVGKEKAASCAGCHGEDGNSMMPGFPKLAGQHQNYLFKQLLAFKKGERNSPMMAPLAMGLDEKAMEEIADYYSAQKVSPNPAPVLPASDDDNAAEITDEQKKAELDELIKQGSDLYRNGNLTREVSACVACHGPYAEGNKPAAYPALHSQHADYLIKALTDFKTGARSNNRENMMHMIATKMTNDDIKAVAYYISTMK